MASQRVINTGIASLALGLLGLAAYHVQYSNSASEMFQVSSRFSREAHHLVTNLTWPCTPLGKCA
jgi:hypothetical protein